MVHSHIKIPNFYIFPFFHPLINKTLELHVNIYLFNFFVDGDRSTYFSNQKGLFFLCLSFPIYHLLSILNDPIKPDLLPSTSSTNPKVRGQSRCVDHKLYVGLFCGNFRVFLDFLFKPVKRITCSAPTFFFCRCWAAWGSCSPGQYPLDRVTTELGDLQAPAMTLLCFSSHLSP